MKRAVALAATALAALPAVAHAQAQPVTLSGASPLAGCAAPALARHGPQRGSEVEPHVAARRDGRVLVAAWQQDRYRTAGALGLGVSVSHDGGATWRPAYVPGATTCPPRGEDFMSDPWVSVGGDGTLYLAQIAGKGAREADRSRIAVHRSLDGGQTWSNRAYVPTPRDGFADKEAITADPRRPGVAYVVWRQDDVGPMFSHTTDHGATWSRPVRLPGGERAGNLILGVLPDGALLVAGPDLSLGGAGLYATRSADGGARWSRPVVIDTFDFGFTEILDAFVRTGPGTSFHVAPDGSAWVAWRAIGPGGTSLLSVARSTDGGRRWRTLEPVQMAEVGFTPAIAAASAGAAAVTWYDQGADRRSDRALTTQVRIATTTDGGSSWRNESLTRWFDLFRAPRTSNGALFLADYTGLVALPNGRYGAAVAVARATGGRRGRSDVRFVAR